MSGDAWFRVSGELFVFGWYVRGVALAGLGLYGAGESSSRDRLGLGCRGARVVCIWTIGSQSDASMCDRHELWARLQTRCVSSVQDD